MKIKMKIGVLEFREREQILFLLLNSYWVDIDKIKKILKNQGIFTRKSEIPGYYLSFSAEKLNPLKILDLACEMEKIRIKKSSSS